MPRRAAFAVAGAALSALLAAGCHDFGDPLPPDAAPPPDAPPADAPMTGDDAGGDTDQDAAPADAPPDGPVPTGVIYTIVMRDMKFLSTLGGALRPLTVHVGDTLHFVNDEPTYVRHQVQDGEVVGGVITPWKLFHSDYLDPGQLFDWVVDAPKGTFLFLCTTHPATMKDQQVTVE